jgi:hypothetical protein
MGKGTFLHPIFAKFDCFRRRKLFNSKIFNMIHRSRKSNIQMFSERNGITRCRQSFESGTILKNCGWTFVIECRSEYRIMGMSMKNALKKASENGHTVISDLLNAGVGKLHKYWENALDYRIQDCDYQNTGLWLLEKTLWLSEYMIVTIEIHDYDPTSIRDVSDFFICDIYNINSRKIVMSNGCDIVRCGNWSQLQKD